MKDVRYSIPGWIDAVAADHENHDLAYVLPHDSIAGVRVRHMTFLDLLRLCAMEFPFLQNPPSEAEFMADAEMQQSAVIAIAYLSVGYREDRRMRNLIRIWRVGRIDKAKLYACLVAYMGRTFYDDSGARSGAQSDPRSLWSAAADVVDLFGSEYGWTADYSLSLPYRQAIQSCRRIIRRLNPKAHIHTKGDDVIYEHLEKLNSGSKSQ